MIRFEGLLWMVGDQVTYADYGWFIMYEMLAQLNMEEIIKTKAPKLYDLVDRIRSIPETKEYIENFKKTNVSVPLF